MHWIVLLTPMPHKPIAIVAILTIYHNLQYHRLIWFHNKKYKSPDDAMKRRDSKYGAAELISRRLAFYIGFGILFGLLYQGPRQFLGYMSFKNGAAGVTDVSFATQLAISFLWGYAFIHYYLDSKIWRVRRDPNGGQSTQYVVSPLSVVSCLWPTGLTIAKRLWLRARLSCKSRLLQNGSEATAFN